MTIKKWVEGCGYYLVVESFLNMNEALGLISSIVKIVIKLV